MVLKQKSEGLLDRERQQEKQKQEKQEAHWEGEGLGIQATGLVTWCPGANHLNALDHNSTSVKEIIFSLLESM